MPSRAWVRAGLWWLSIILTAPLGRPVVDFLRGANLLRLSVGAALLVAGALVIHGWRGGEAWLRRRGPQLVGLLLLGVWAALLPRTEERWHIIQFGVLGGLVATACAARRRGVVWAALLSAGAGLFDELLQGLLPARYFGWDDVVLNVAAAWAGVAFALLDRRVVAQGSTQTKPDTPE